MRFAILFLAIAPLCFPNAASAQPSQGPIEYSNIQDRFRASFPARPRVESTSFKILNVNSGEDMVLKARRHVAEWKGGRFSVTAINFAPYFEPHNTTIQSAIAQAAATFRKMGKVTYDAYQRTDRIPGHQLYITLPGGERLHVLIVLHQETVRGEPKLGDTAERRLLIAEARIPKEERPPTFFLASLQVIEPDGKRIRYEPNGVWKVPGH